MNKHSVPPGGDTAGTNISFYAARQLCQDMAGSVPSSLHSHVIVMGHSNNATFQPWDPAGVQRDVMHCQAAAQGYGSHEHTRAACNLVALGLRRYVSMYAQTTTRGHWHMADARTGEPCCHVVAWDLAGMGTGISELSHGKRVNGCAHSST